MFLRKLKRILDDDYLTIYIDFKKSECYQKDKMSLERLMQHYYKEILLEASHKNLNTFQNRILKFFKTNNFKLKEWTNIKGVPLPLFDAEVENEDLVDFVMDLPQQLYNENMDKIKGIIIFLDDFQVIKELDKQVYGFLSKFRSFIQDQNRVAYVLSGSMSMQDKLIVEIASRGGVFGGRMLTLHIEPFTPITLRNYLSDKAPDLLLSDEAFNKFYELTNGIPYFVNSFGRLLPTNILLQADDVENTFLESINLLSIHLISLWFSLKTREQDIIISLLNGPIRRVDIAKAVNLTSGSLSNSLNKLINLDLIYWNGKCYEISEPMLSRWLMSEYEKKSIYPYRSL